MGRQWVVTVFILAGVLVITSPATGFNVMGPNIALHLQMAVEEIHAPAQTGVPWVTAINPVREKDVKIQECRAVYVVLIIVMFVLKNVNWHLAAVISVVVIVASGRILFVNVFMLFFRERVKADGMIGQRDIVNFVIVQTVVAEVHQESPVQEIGKRQIYFFLEV